MGALKFTMTCRIPAPPHDVWPYLVDWENLGLWMKEGSDFEVTSSHREGVGVTARATIRIAGIRTTDHIEVTGWDPPRMLGIEHLGWVTGQGLMHLEGVAGGTLLRWEETLVPPLGPLGKGGMWLLRPYISHVFERDLRLLRRLVQTTPGG